MINLSTISESNLSNLWTQMLKDAPRPVVFGSSSSPISRKREEEDSKEESCEKGNYYYFLMLIHFVFQMDSQFLLVHPKMC